MKTIEQLQEENAALSAQIEALREAYYSYIETGFDEILDKAFGATPQHHLREVRAEAAYSGYVAGWSFQRKQLEPAATQYADQIRRGEV